MTKDVPSLEDAKPPDDVPFPDSLCHRCAAPPRYIRTARSLFIHCPILKQYPPQPVSSCDAFVPADRLHSASSE
jgi:hypothetical protein